MPVSAWPDLANQQASGPQIQPDTLKELVRLVELDYDRTAKFIDGVLGTSATIRTLLITAWVAVLTLAFDTSRWALGAISFAIIVVFGVLDAYHSALYQHALNHAVERESASQSYYETLIFGDDYPDASANLIADLELQEFGVYRNIHKVSSIADSPVRPASDFVQRPVSGATRREPHRHHHPRSQVVRGPASYRSSQIAIFRSCMFMRWLGCRLK